MITLRLSVLAVSLLSGVCSLATHIVGGEIYYRCLGNNNYEITMKIYRDCYLGQAGFDQPANLAIYQGTGNTPYVTLTAFPTITNIPVIIGNVQQQSVLQGLSTGWHLCQRVALLRSLGH